MNVLLVHNFYQQAGGEDQVFADEGALLEKHGHTVARFTMDNDAIAQMSKLELARKTIWNSDAQKSLKDAIREIKAEVVHFHNTFPLISPAAYYAAHEAGAAVVQTLHNYRLLCPAATFYRNGGVCEKCLGRAVPWPGVLHKCYRGNRVATAAVAAMLSYHRTKRTWRDQVDVYIALTEFARSKLVEGGLPEEKIVVKPNFVDPDPGPGKGDGDYALFVGRLTEEKGLRTLVKAWDFLADASGMFLGIIGDGPLREELHHVSASRPGIRYFGRRLPAEVLDMMGAARMLIFPSVWYDGQPRTIIESLAKGTPVVCSRLGSMTEMIDHGRTGLLFEAGDPRDLARQVESLQNDPADRERMRHAARSEFESRFTSARNYPALLACYERACGKPVAEQGGRTS
jgi:glycosyltransferase involved in cell wall biosynthesis